MSDLISCCSWCVAEGTEAAPPMELRTDGICGRHLLEMKARIFKDRQPGVGPQPGTTDPLTRGAERAAPSHKESA